MAEKLSRGASGLRHLRWAREIYATLAAHAEASEVSEPQRAALSKELTRLDARIQGLSGAVKGYRDFLERERVRYRGAIRAALHAGALAERGVVEHPADFGLAVAKRREAAPETLARARARAGELRALAAGRRTGPGEVSRLEAAASRIEEAIRSMQTEALPRQRALKAALEVAVSGLREALEDMDGRLAGVVSDAFVDSLYPALARGGTIVADEGDEDDDSAARA
ncbi:hypothetical protein [Polyangium aurulentum]|uniref:hypothetical protein n=1 Tax=Polyangium aurulentum TaxID=2567896 RepID=UPI0010AE1C15|nr:hypothetical protein [Polyangium aurulentum]UQA56586.1 hypothetical protein E8A73_035545 [Polyangium aurulentum]